MPNDQKMDFRTFFANLFISCGLGRIFGLRPRRNIPERTENKSGAGDTSSEAENQTTTPKIPDVPEIKTPKSDPTVEIVEYDSTGEFTDDALTQDDAKTAMSSDINDKIVGIGLESSPAAAAASLNNDGIDKVIDAEETVGGSEDVKSHDATIGASSSHSSTEDGSKLSEMNMAEINSQSVDKSVIDRMTSDVHEMKPANVNENTASVEISEINYSSDIVLNQPDVESQPPIIISDENVHKSPDHAAPAFHPNVEETHVTLTENETHASDLLGNIPESDTNNAPINVDVPDIKNMEVDSDDPLVPPASEDLDTALKSLNNNPESTKITHEIKDSTRDHQDVVGTLAAQDSLHSVPQISNETTVSNSSNHNRQLVVGDAGGESTYPAPSYPIVRLSPLEELTSRTESSGDLADSKWREVEDAEKIDVLQEEKAQHLVQQAITTSLEQISNSSKEDDTPEEK